MVFWIDGHPVPFTNAQTIMVLHMIHPPFRITKNKVIMVKFAESLHKEICLSMQMEISTSDSLNVSISILPNDRTEGVKQYLSVEFISLLGAGQNHHVFFLIIKIPICEIGEHALHLFLCCNLIQHKRNKQLSEKSFFWVIHSIHRSYWCVCSINYIQHQQWHITPYIAEMILFLGL